MIAVDTSAVVAILWFEPDQESLRAKLANARGAVVSTGTTLEIQHVLLRTGTAAGWPEVEALFQSYAVEIRVFDQAQLRIAREAAVRFGRSKHKARLNFGDCFAYALAKSEGLPLLCKGGDFAHTDLTLA